MRRLPPLATATLLLCGSLRAADPTHPVEEFNGPFSTWADVKRDYGAAGDGKADDTAALQRALDDGGTPTSRWSALWLPAGTYRITKTLVRVGVAGPMIIGEHPDKVILKWDGPAVRRVDRAWRSPEWEAWDGRDESEMFWFNGRNLRLERITFDGSGKAGSGFAFKWHDSKDPRTTPPHRISLSDVAFRDVAIGFDGGGKQLWLDSEVLLRRCRFIRCSESGLGLHHFNSVDYWLLQCEFTDCNVGVSNEPKPHGGVFHVYDSVFRNSREADATIFHAGFFALRNNTSIGSKRFFHAKNNGANGARITLQGNTIIGPQATDALVFETLGNINLMDNVIVSSAGATSGPVVRAAVRVAEAPPRETNAVKDQEFVPVNVSAVGNTFTVPCPFAVRGKLLELDTRIVERNSLNPSVPVLPGVPPQSTERVFEVAKGSDGAAIQQAVDAAVAFARAHEGARPVVHLPQGVYPVTNTLTIPAGVPVQMVGDGACQWSDGMRGVVLKWADETTPGPVLRLLGPSRALLRDFSGQLTLINMDYDLHKENPLLRFEGACDGARVLLLGLGTEVPNEELRPGSVLARGANVTIANLCHRATQWPDQNADAERIRSLLAQTRAVRLEPPAARPAGVTDLRLYRVWTEYARTGLDLRGRGQVSAEGI